MNQELKNFSDSNDNEDSSDYDEENESKSSDASDAEETPAVRMMMLPMLCVFQGYACMVGPAQQKFKAELGIGQGSEKAMIFTQAAVFVHYGKLVARLGHEFIFGFLTPLQRVYVSMALVLVGTFIPPFFVFDLHDRWIGFVFLSYGLTGIGLGVFECTYLAVITPMGKLTKAWAIMGIPLGFGIVNILGLLCTSAGMPVACLYWYIVSCIPVGMFVIMKFGSGLNVSSVGGHGHGASMGVQQKNLLAAVTECGAWLPLLLPHLIAKISVNFVMENATPVNYYVYNAGEVPLWGPDDNSQLVKHDLFFAVLGVFVMVGDAVSRRVPASLELSDIPSNLVILGLAVMSSLIGFWLESFAIAILALLGIFMAFWGNGMVYGTSAKFIDHWISKEYTLVSYSMWCFVGDIGAIIGGVTVDIIRNRICGESNFLYECKMHN